MDYVTTEEFGDLEIRIAYDTDPMNPREWDNLGTMVCFHRNYNLGDKHDYRNPESFFLDLWNNHATQEEKRKVILQTCKGNIGRLRYLLERNESDNIDGMFEDVVENYLEIRDIPNNVIALPLFLYDHSGITMNTCGFSCPWDSGQVGMIYITMDKIKQEYGDTNPETIERVKTYLKNEVETYDQFLTGQVYGFMIVKPTTCESCNHCEDEILESCWGFFGEDDCLQEARSMAKYLTENKTDCHTS